MRETDLRGPGAPRPADRPPAGRQSGDDAQGFRPALSGDRRGALRPGEPWLAGVVSASGRADADRGAVSGGGQRPSGGGGADGGLVRPSGGVEPDGGFRFDRPVCDDGYLWWYLDALSEDGSHGLTLIAFIGSVFSPYYAWARRRGAADPLNHCAVNVALYGPRGKRWAMTERPPGRVRRTADALTIGPSSMFWDGEALTIDIDEVTAPLPSRIRGKVRLYPGGLSARQFALDDAGDHHWNPMSPCSHVEVALDRPSLRWSGSAYLDSNKGDVPLEKSFNGWNWSRAKIGNDTAVFYDVAPRQGEGVSLSLRFDPAGAVTSFDPPPRRQLPATLWRIRRETRADTGYDPKVRQTLEDAPFYARSVLSTRLLGEPATAIHESLSMDRFDTRLVRAMLPFRMPRWPL